MPLNCLGHPSVDGGATIALLPGGLRRPVLTAVAGCHLYREQCLPDPADTSTSLASLEVLAVDAAGRGSCHVCQLSSCPLYRFDAVMYFRQNGQRADPLLLPLEGHKYLVQASDSATFSAPEVL
jgi:hypothetical protein